MNVAVWLVVLLPFIVGAGVAILLLRSDDAKERASAKWFFLGGMIISLVVFVGFALLLRFVAYLYGKSGSH